MSNILQLSYKNEAGVKGVDDDPDNPPSRALAQLTKRGRPLKRMTMAWLVDRREVEIPYLRWFGIFVLTERDRVLFFPGFEDEVQHVVAHRGKGKAWSNKLRLNHFTLESDFKSWHITGEGVIRHQGGFSTREVADGHFLWFGLSAVSLDQFRVLKRETKIVVEVPDTDHERRKRIFLDAVEGADDKQLDWPDVIWEAAMSGGYFWHLSVFVSNAGNEMYKGTDLPIPANAPFLTKPLPLGRIAIPTRPHRFGLSRELFLQINNTALRGGLKVPLGLTSLEPK